jgi:acyl-CoA synthetase (AMP-forming)/AMP-acid ligase II
VTGFDAALNEPGALSPPGTIPLDLAALIYTSGSTGQPKGVMQTHQSMLFAADSLTEYLRLDESDRILCLLPLAFDYGLYQLLMAITLGATLVLERSFTYPAQIYSRMIETGVTVFPGVPTIYAMMISAHARAPLVFGSVRRITNTAAALPDAFVTKLREIFPKALIYKMYGLTECKRVCYLEPELADLKPGSVGKAIPGTEVYLLGEDGQPVPPGATGILLVRGPHVMVGYWNRPDLSELMLKPGKLPGERVLCTHDHFRMDTEGFLYFVGRTDDIIKTRGEKVSPVEVEEALHRIPGVREAAVVGIPDEVLGQAIRAYVVPELGATLSEKQIRALSAGLLEAFMVPKEVVFRDALPKTTTGKVSKRLLLEGQ